LKVIKYNEYQYHLSERNYRQLLRRFDASRAMLTARGCYFLPVKSICWERKSKCLKCPLRSPQKRIVSCTYLFSRIMGEELSGCIHMYDVGIFWDSRLDEQARRALARVTTVLKTAAEEKEPGRSKA